MAETETVRARIDPKLKFKTEEILKRLGITPTQAIILFYKQIQILNGLPFDIRIPNDITIEALEDAERGRKLKRFKTSKELYTDLGI